MTIFANILGIATILLKCQQTCLTQYPNTKAHFVLSKDTITIFFVTPEPSMSFQRYAIIDIEILISMDTSDPYDTHCHTDRDYADKSPSNKRIVLTCKSISFNKKSEYFMHRICTF